MRLAALIVLLATLLAGCTVPSSGDVLGPPPPPHPLSASTFTWEPFFPTAGEPVRFTPTLRSSAPGDELLGLRWDFGGRVSTDSRPVHVFQQAGLHDVHLTIQARDGGRLTLRDTVEVLPDGADPSPPDGPAPTAPTDAAAPAIAAGVDGSTVRLSFAFDGIVQSIHWDLGDGTESTEREPVHTYAAPGDYHVSLRILSQDGIRTASHTVTIEWPERVRSVVATFDTGTNPFHPCFRRTDGPSAREAIPEIAATARSLNLTLADTYDASLSASRDALAAIEPWTLYAVEGTNLLYFGGSNAADELVDDYPHGAQASSQIGCREHGMAGDSFLLILNWYDTTADQKRLLDWVARQSWIDVVHLNIQITIPWAIPSEETDGIEAVIGAGKLVVIAAGNGLYNLGVNLPMETSHYNGPPGSLIAGANDQTGYALFSNLDPHTVMDGGDTVAAAPDSFGTTSFGGTSSASPRTSGYAAHLLHRLRDQVGHRGGMDGGALVAVEPGAYPGPLADGALTAAELHEVIRTTADPTLPPSRYDGGTSIWYVPNPAPTALYQKAGYGKLTEETVEDALDVLLGQAPMPERSVEDTFYEASETVRREYWGGLW